MSREVQILTVDPGEDGSRLDRWFRRRWPHVSNIQVNKLARSGQIRVDGARVKGDSRLSAGAQVRVPPLPEPGDRPEGPPILSDQDVRFIKGLVLFEDASVLAINKPSGLAVQGGTQTTRHVDRLLSAWGAWLDWAERDCGVRLHRAQGIAHVGQPVESTARVRDLALQADDFALTGLATATGLYGSAILALAVQQGALSGEDAFDLSRLDEAFQEEQWGVDAEAAGRTAARRAEAILLGHWFAALRD